MFSFLKAAAIAFIFLYAFAFAVSWPRAHYERQQDVRLPDLPRPSGEIFSINWDVHPQMPKASCELRLSTPGYPQSVNVSAIYSSALAIWLNRADACAQTASRHLLTIIETNTQLQDGGRYFLYKFRHNALGYTAESPWVSGYGQGVLLSALSYLHDAFHDDRSAMLAREVYETFKQDRITRRVQGYYWIEEFPVKNAVTLILNGHIAGLMGIYDYLGKVSPSDDPSLLYEALETAKVFSTLFRRIGKVNCYDLSVCADDYSPPRTVQQQRFLFEITSDPVFRDHAEMFASDFNGAKLHAPNSFLARVKFAAWYYNQLLVELLDDHNTVFTSPAVIGRL